MASKFFKLLILLILCVSNIWGLDVCEDQLNGAQLLHPLDCSKYIVCRFGMTYRIETCDGGRHFNRLTAECTDPIEAACDIDLIKKQFVLSNECDTCRSICGCSAETQCSTSSSSTPDLSPYSTTTSSNPTTPAFEISSSTTPSTDSFSSSVSSSETTDHSSSRPGSSSETTVGSTETTPHISSETTSSSITTPEATETTPNASSAKTTVTPALDTSSEVTVTTSPAENNSSTPHIPSPSTTDATATRPNTPSPDISSSISPGSTSPSSNTISTTSATTSIPPNPETPASPTPTTSVSCTNNLKICVGKADFSIIYVPGSCREYAVCIDNCANVLSCPNNLLYDLENHVCTYPQNVKCSQELQPPSGPSAGPSGTKCESRGKCENQPDGALFADDSTDGYIVCQCECEVARPCPSGLVFNQEIKVCDFPVIS